MWDPKQYSKFEKERTLPSYDLSSAIVHDNVTSVIDIGCGIGNSTAVLKERFPNAKVIGADNSDSMLLSARKSHPDISFIKIDASDLSVLNQRYDIVFSNACIQWIPNHVKLLRDMMGLLNDKGVLAVQVPLQSKHPMHKIIQEMAKSEKWSEKLGEVRPFYVLTESEYFDVLTDLSDNFRIWETVYYHAMPSHRAIIEWYKGTGLRPYLEKLSDADKPLFEEDIFNAVKAEYSLQKNGEIIFRFPRLFFTAQK